MAVDLPERVNDFEIAAERIECRCVFLLLTQHLACGRSRQWSCSHGQERFLAAQLRVAAMNRLKKLAALPLGQIRCGLPKRQSRVRRRPTVARVGYSPSRDFSRLANVFAGDHRTASSFHEYVCSVTPIFLTAIGNGLASPHLDFDSRSLWMASSFFPRGMECPPLVVTPPDYLSGSGAVEGGQVRPLSLLSLPSALEREQGSRFVLRVRCELWHE